MSENTVHDIANRLLASPRKSLRVLSQEIGLSRSACQRAAKKAGLHVYRFRVVQEHKQQANIGITSVRNKVFHSARFYCALLTLHVSAPFGGHLQVIHKHKKYKVVPISIKYWNNLRAQHSIFSARFYCALITLHVSAPFGGHLQVVHKWNKNVI
jgi:hypothetical protein